MKLIVASSIAAAMEIFNSPEVLTGSLKYLKQRKASLNHEWPGRDREASRRDQSGKQPEKPVPQQKKQRRFIDPQENAGRVSPDQDAISQNLNREGTGEEEDFQQDRRPLPAPKRRKRTPGNKPAATKAAATEPTDKVSGRARGRRPKRERIVVDDNDNAEGAAASDADGSTTSLTGKKSDPTGRSNVEPVTDEEPHGDEDPPPPPAERVQLENYKMAKELARINTAARAKKKTQTRKAWTDLETETLINLISEYGTSWKLLKDKDAGKVLVDRDQIALKDKARNIKFDYLK